jgi:hypothetical protein
VDRLELHDRRLVEVCRLDGEAHGARNLAAAFCELLLGSFSRLLALPE